MINETMSSETDSLEEAPDGCKLYNLTGDDGVTIQFYGTHLGGVSTKRVNSYFWFEADAYRTRGGLWVISERSVTLIDGQVDRSSVHVFQNDRQMMKKLAGKRSFFKLWKKIGLTTIFID